MRTLTALSALAGLLAVGLGAFGAHAIGESFSEKQIGWWDTASFYLLVHAVAGIALSIADRSRGLALPGVIMVSGAAVFAATLYAMALGAPTWLGAITPIGGIGMLAGWSLILFSTLRSR